MGFERQLALLPGFCGGCGANAADIGSAEHELCLAFADDYRAYLLAYGTAICEGHELTGISSSPRLDVVAATKRARELEPQVSHDLYIIEDGAIDGILIWQDGEGTVWETSPGARPRRYADSLLAYLEEG